MVFRLADLSVSTMEDLVSHRADPRHIARILCILLTGDECSPISAQNSESGPGKHDEPLLQTSGKKKHSRRKAKNSALLLK